ncbi:EmrB/QacA subfamily drug resistance transporter [Pullulanibacillus pueri]|uniref:MFS transporter n=1 Tax=Pullulanibacillus pueri TaxID=1437324 RepID=A0A8J2ZX10_9BACL|nr:MFS transporter [Pullulanibacillus pueri]MBM7683600.1 EmrB/QacA subfamily drug resistance transporter [Pullulanibacillus pueri]GGH84548.1 MFS transporter [Pullulanibacillus pueri]
MKKNSYPWLVLSVTSLGVLLSAMNLSTLNVALPEVSNHFHAGAVASNWILLSYMLFNTVLILVFGKLADIYGRRKLYLFGLTEFSIVSLLIGFSPNIWVLILLRIFQAVGGALVITNTTPLITDAFDKRRLGAALSINVLVASVAQLAGPVVGGGLGFALGWRWVFWFNVPLGIIGVIWGFFVLRPVPGRAKEEKVDWLGNITVFLGLGGLIFALSEGGIVGWGNLSVILGLAAFVIFTACFVWVERHARFPMIDFSLFRIRPYTMANLATFINSLARSSIVLLIALFFQVIDHENAFVAGLKVLPVTIGMIIASPIVGALASKYSSRLLSTSGLIGTCIGMCLLVWNIGPHASVFWISFGQLLIGMGTGIFQTPNTQSIMLTVPIERRGVANGLRSMLQSMGQVISTALSLMIVTSALPTRLKDVIYAGTSAHLASDDVVLISNGYRLAFIVMMLLTVLAIAASYLRSSGRSRQSVKE